jgi:hypothetical protein
VLRNGFDRLGNMDITKDREVREGVGHELGKVDSSIVHRRAWSQLLKSI